MSTTTADGLGGFPNAPSYQAAIVGPLEQKHMRNANYRAVAGDSQVTPTHRHIAIANGLGWGFDGMDGVIFALISPLIIKDFSLTVPEYRTGLQVSLFVAPLLVFLSAFNAEPLTLSFGLAEVIAVSITVALAAYIAIDGLTSWLEGAQLLALWGILALFFFFYKPLSLAAQ